MKKIESRSLALKIRMLSLELCHRSGASHIGSSLSVADILAVLYADILRFSPENPKDLNRDRLFYSKGHACAALYAALSLVGFYKSDDLINNFVKDGSYFTSHVNHKIQGVELSTGSLGHALGVACGSALAARRRRQNYRVFAVLSDGELDEGSNWEAILFAAHHRLDNLDLIIDFNKLQSFGRVDDIICLEPLLSKMNSFNWDVYQVNGHDHDALSSILSCRGAAGKPRCVIANTVKGKGVSYMEDQLSWHYKSPTAEQLELAISELSRGSL